MLTYTRIYVLILASGLTQREQAREPRSSGVFHRLFPLNCPISEHGSQNVAIWQWLGLANMTKVIGIRCIVVCQGAKVREIDKSRAGLFSYIKRRYLFLDALRIISASFGCGRTSTEPHCKQVHRYK